MLEAVPWENPTYGISGGAAGNVAYGGTVNPLRNRKGGAGNPPPTGARASALPDTCVSERICLDDVTREAEAVALYDEAIEFVTSRVGAIERKPRAIFCASRSCFRSFGFDTAGAHAVGVSGIVVGPHGWKDYYIRHEMIHHLQAERLGVVRQWLLPKWFTEGMAYSLSGDPRPPLTEPRKSYREKFERWYRSVGKGRIWTEVRKL